MAKGGITIDATVLFKRLNNAPKIAISEAIPLVNDACRGGTVVAKANARVDTGALSKSLLPESAVVRGDVVMGRFGTQGIHYAGYQNDGYTSARGRGKWVPGTNFMQKGLIKANEVMGDKGGAYLKKITE
jgi:hypothetical protein